MLFLVALVAGPRKNMYFWASLRSCFTAAYDIYEKFLDISQLKPYVHETNIKEQKCCLLKRNLLN